MSDDSAGTTRRSRKVVRRAGPPAEPVPVVSSAAPAGSGDAPKAAEPAAPAQQAAEQKAPEQKAPAQQAAEQKSTPKSAPRGDRRRGGGGGGGRRGSDRGPKAPSAVVDRLGPPPKLPKGGLRVVALGGIGEIGRNMTVFEYDGKLLIVDCGVLFPEEQQPGVDLILPDFRYIEDRIDDVEAIVLTHGHEDHIGAVPFLLRLRPDIPVIGLEVHAGAARGEVQGAPSAPEAGRGHRGRATGARPVRVRVLRGQPLDPGRDRRRDPHAGAGWCCTPATSSSTSCRSTAGSPTSPVSPGSATRAWTCSSSTRPTPRSRGSSRPNARSAAVLDNVIGKAKRPRDRGVVRQPRAPHPAGRRRRAQRTAGGSCFVGRSMVRNMQIAQELGYLTRARRRGGRPGHRREPAGTTSWCWSRPGRRASRCRRCRGWRAASTARSTSAPTISWCWRRR